MKLADSVFLEKITTPSSLKNPVIWRLSDNNPGHDSQSKGLVKALSLIKPCHCYDISLSDRQCGFMDLWLKKFPLADELPAPNMIIGAGHATHWPMLCAKRTCGGKTIALMKPSIPTGYFDLCFIPEHDNPKRADNIFATKGAINSITPSTRKTDHRGLILIGGPSRHFYWNDEYLLQQLKEILTTHVDIQWAISDSSRTPEITSKRLKALPAPNAEYKSYANTPQDYIAQQLNIAANVWISVDSVSMVYESLTSGAAVGLLEVPARKKNKILNNIAHLVKNRMVLPYSEWLFERQLKRPPILLNEAQRCATKLQVSGFLN